MSPREDQSLHAVAEQWASTQAELRRAEEQERLAKSSCDRLRQRLTTLSEQLSKRVGPNQPTRVFKVSADEVVLVQHERAIQLQEIEAKG